MKAADWIDRLKKAKEWDSDYRVAKELDCRPQTISQYRNKGGTLDDMMAVKVAGALGTRPEIIILDQVAERTKNDDAKAAIERVLRKLGGTVAMFVMVLLGWGGGPPPATAGEMGSFDITISASTHRIYWAIRHWLSKLVRSFTDAQPLPA